MGEGGNIFFLKYLWLKLDIYEREINLSISFPGRGREDGGKGIN